MSFQPQLFSKDPLGDPLDTPPAMHHSAEPGVAPPPSLGNSSSAPLWLQRLSLFILVVFCIYLGVIVTLLPWWSAVWDGNPVFSSFPRLAHILRLGPVRGIISGLGLLDIWIGVSEAIHYRDHRN